VDLKLTKRKKRRGGGGGGGEAIKKPHKFTVKVPAGQ